MLSEVYLGLGSNLGDRGRNVGQGVTLLRGLSPEVTVSGLYETRPQGFGDQPAFVNAACHIWTRLDPFELLARLKGFQAGVSRPAAFVNGPRTLDIDILIFGRRVLDTPILTIPHPRMAERDFVLTPLAEIAPGLEHPVLRLSVRHLLRRLRASGRAEWVVAYS